MHQKEQVGRGVEDGKNFPAVERRRNSSVSDEQREAGEVAVFQELGKALTSSLQLDQVLRTIMEKIDEFLRPDNWSLLLLDERSEEHTSELQSRLHLVCRLLLEKKKIHHYHSLQRSSVCI